MLKVDIMTQNKTEMIKEKISLVKFQTPFLLVPSAIKFIIAMVAKFYCLKHSKQFCFIWVGILLHYLKWFPDASYNMWMFNSAFIRILIKSVANLVNTQNKEKCLILNAIIILFEVLGSYPTRQILFHRTVKRVFWWFTFYL